METLKTLLKKKNIVISFRYYGAHDYGTRWEVKSIIDSQDVFCDFYSKYPLTGIRNFDDFYLYLLSCKLAEMREIIPQLIQEEHKKFFSELSDNANEAISHIDIGDAIKFINGNIQEIFKKDNQMEDLYSVTLDIIEKYGNGINKNTYEFLCNNGFGFHLLYRYDQFEKMFERYPDLFVSVFPTGHLQEIDSLRLERTLEIWRHIIKKAKSNLKSIVIERIEVLEKDIKTLWETATIDNIMRIERIIRQFFQFLQRIQSPKANAFAEYAKKATILLEKSIDERGQSIEFDLPIKKMIDTWKKVDNQTLRLLCLTHEQKGTDRAPSFVSYLSKEPEAKHPRIDRVNTNIPVDDFFTMSHQHTLMVSEIMGAAMMMEIIEGQFTLEDYLGLVMNAISLIAEQLNAEEEQLSQDIEMLSALVKMVANNKELNKGALQGICYSTSMFACALSEKILRVLYINLAKDEKFIPVSKITLGELLDENNTYMVDVFEKSHIKNLSFFLQQTSQSNVGQNIRNSLAHWASISTFDMTPLFVGKMLWIFTDILNTVFGFCLKNIMEKKENNDQL